MTASQDRIPLGQYPITAALLPVALRYFTELSKT